MFLFSFSVDDPPPHTHTHKTNPQPLNKKAYFTSSSGLYTVDLNDLTVDLPFAWIKQQFNLYSECAFSADYTVLYGTHPEKQGEFQIIDQQTGNVTLLEAYADPVVYDLGGCSFFGTNGPNLIPMEVRL